MFQNFGHPPNHTLDSGDIRILATPTTGKQGKKPRSSAMQGHGFLRSQPSYDVPHTDRHNSALLGYGVGGLEPWRTDRVGLDASLPSAILRLERIPQKRACLNLSCFAWRLLVGSQASLVFFVRLPPIPMWPFIRPLTSKLIPGLRSSLPRSQRWEFATFDTVGQVHLWASKLKSL